MKPYINDSDFTLYVGDVRDVLAGLPDESVHCVVTSPPYWGLRDYGTGLWDGGDPDHAHESVPARGGRGGSGAPGKQTEGAFPSVLAVDECSCGARRVDRQLGLEATPDEYVQNMVAVFREVRRVLRRDGTCWLNLGDSYAATRSYQVSDSKYKAHDFAESNAMAVPPGLKPKDLVGIPWRVAFALQADGWYLRSDIIWSKPNTMPESVTDRPTKAHEYLFLLTRSPRYFYDADAIRESATWERWGGQTTAKYNGQGQSKAEMVQRRSKGEIADRFDTSQRNRRSVWEIATEPYPDAHFATFPQALVEPCVKAGTSERGCCPECGAPWERETEPGEARVVHWAPGTQDKIDKAQGPHGESSVFNTGAVRERLTTGWRPSCACVIRGGIGSDGNALYDYAPEPVPCTVLDIFMGSGTTAQVARRLGRRSIGIELNADYAALAARRTQQQSLLA